MNEGDGLRQAGPASGYRVYRGGLYTYAAQIARSAYRLKMTPEVRYSFLGLRPARAITTP